MPNQTHIIRFDGRYFSYTDLNGILVRIPAISGDTSYQNSEFQGEKDFGPIPGGFYDVRQSEYQVIDVTNGIFGIAGLMGIDIGTWPTSIFGWGTERVWLQPQAGTDTFGRDEFSIHGGATAGSAGCIDLVSQASTFFSFFKSLGENVVLQVDYGSGYNGLDNPLTNGITDVSIENIYSSQGLDLNELEPLKFLQDQVRTQLEQQLQMSIPEQSLGEILKNYNFASSSQLTNFLEKYQLNSDLSSLSNTIPSLIINDGNGGNFNLLALPNFSDLVGAERTTAWDNFTNSFLETALAPFSYDIDQFTDFLNLNRISFSEFERDDLRRGGVDV